MLTPEQLAHCADDIINLYSQLEEEIVRDIARRIAKTGIMTDTGIWQAQHMQELGTLHSRTTKPTILRSTGGLLEIFTLL